MRYSTTTIVALTIILVLALPANALTDAETAQSVVALHIARGAAPDNDLPDVFRDLYDLARENSANAEALVRRVVNESETSPFLDRLAFAIIEAHFELDRQSLGALGELFLSLSRGNPHTGSLARPKNPVGRMLDWLPPDLH